jgi:hypothetical protein
VSRRENESERVREKGGERLIHGVGREGKSGLNTGSVGISAEHRDKTERAAAQEALKSTVMLVASHTLLPTSP